MLLRVNTFCDYQVMEDFAELFEQNAEIEDLAILDFIQHGIPRQMYIRQNYFDTMDEANFRRRFRLCRQSVLIILELIEKRLEFPYDM